MDRDRANKVVLAEHIADQTGKTPAEAKAMVNDVLSSISRLLIEGKDVAVTGFGTLRVADAPERPARNPHTGEPIVVPARKTVRFRPGTSLIEYVNGAPVPTDRSLVTKRPKSS